MQRYKQTRAVARNKCASIMFLKYSLVATYVKPTTFAYNYDAWSGLDCLRWWLIIIYLWVFSMHFASKSFEVASTLTENMCIPDKRSRPTGQRHKNSGFSSWQEQIWLAVRHCVRNGSGYQRTDCPQGLTGSEGELTSI
jgi:hypothetical protein